MKYGPILIALSSGAALAVQVGMNNTLRAKTGHPLIAAWMSFAIGTAALTIYLAILRPTWPDRSSFANAPWWIWGGGLVGAVYIACAAAFAGRLGAAAWLGLIVTGQIAASLTLDHFGLVGFARKPITTTKIFGAMLLLAGVVIVLWPTNREGKPTSATSNDRRK